MSLGDYDPSPEFSISQESLADDQSAPEDRRQLFRLVVLKSPVIPSKRRIAPISSHSEVSIGRDWPANPHTTPRLRLKEMAVSKYHAILFWDAQGERWGLVDVGSVHGTFVESESTPGYKERLSSPKVASHPRYLHHLDVITIGTTQLCCHIHQEEGEVCDSCELTLSNEVKLFKEQDRHTPDSFKQGEEDPRLTAPTTDVKSSLSNLKAHLISKHGPSMSRSSTGNLYVDRAAARRQQLGISQPHPTPSISASSDHPRHNLTVNDFVTRSRLLATSTSVADTEEVPQAIPVSNIGHRLLQKQGWEPGTGLGLDQSGRPEPLSHKGNTGRAGLGTPSSR
ncbi:G-patch-domain-containing protein [Serendipita vermifera]|nr:G-patch-domain-containing protein [Serendipita vermifera]